MTMASSGEDDRLLGIREVSDILGVPVRTLHRWRAHGDGPPGVRLAGTTVRWRRSALLGWIAEREAADQAAHGGGER